MPQDPDQDAAIRVVQVLRAALSDRLVAVVLFGSRSRGEAGAESDWDLLVVVRDLPTSPLERLLSVKQLLPLGCEGVSLLLRTPEEFTDHVSSLHLDIALDGKILYDPQGYMADRLSHPAPPCREPGSVPGTDGRRSRVAMGEATSRAVGTEAEGMRRMPPGSEAEYRLSLAEGLLHEARQDLDLARLAQGLFGGGGAP